jgi:hypothetical protein
MRLTLCDDTETNRVQARERLTALVEMPASGKFC